MNRRKLCTVLTAVLTIVGGLAVHSGIGRLSVEAFTLRPCHDDTSISRNNTHGSPLNGSFGQVGASPNHSNGYYYLDIADGPGCAASTDGHIHLVGRVQANGTGLLPGCTPSTNWGPPCDPSFRAVSGAAMANERPSWGFEIKDAASGADVACTGGDGSGGSNCPGTPNITANPGNATVEFRFDDALAGHGYRFRLDNQYDDPIWEYATFDVVACSTCEPSGVTASPTPPPSSTATPGPTPIPYPVSMPIKGVPCTIKMGGTTYTGTCSGTFTRKGP